MTCEFQLQSQHKPNFTAVSPAYSCVSLALQHTLCGKRTVSR